MYSDKLHPYGLPLSHRNVGFSSEYDYHQAMAQHAAAVSGGNSSVHSSMSQLPMMSQGLNLSMNSGFHSLNSGLQSNAGSTGHLSQAGNGGGKIKKKMKVNKDGVPAPKRATTGYINFTQWYREEQKRNGRQIPKIGEFGKECADKWNSMASDKKQPFLDVAARDRERYRKEMAIFKPARDANKPKRPGTAFMLYMADLRKEMAGKEPEGGVAALAKLGGERWRGMTDEDKHKYIEKQQEVKVVYEASMEEYRKKQSLTNLSSVASPPEESVNDISDNLELPIVATASLTPQLAQASANSNSSDSSEAHASLPNSVSPPSPAMSPELSDASDSPNISMAGTQFTDPTSLSQAMAMGYAQQTLSNFAQANGMMLHNQTFNQAPTTFSSSDNMTQSSPTYNQSLMQAPFTWN